jgi:hypothetical protein
VGGQLSGDANNTPVSSNPGSEPVTVTLASSTLSLTAAPTPAFVGQAVTLTATVSCPGFSPSGTVTFVDGGTTLGSAPVSGGMASLSTSSLAAGSHSLTASYSGDASCAAATAAPVGLLVSQPPLLVLPLPSPTSPTSPSSSPPSSGIVVYDASGQPGSVALRPGCSSVVVSTPAGTPLSALAALVQPPGSVVSLWHYTNSLLAWQAGYFASGGPTDVVSSTGGGSEAYAVCVSVPATLSNG